MIFDRFADFKVDRLRRSNYSFLKRFLFRYLGNLKNGYVLLGSPQIDLEIRKTSKKEMILDRLRRISEPTPLRGSDYSSLKIFYLDI